MAFHGATQFTPDGAGVADIVELDVVDDDIFGAQLFGEMPHRGEHEGNLLLVMLDIGGLASDFGHEYDVAVAVIAQGCDVARQLVSEHKSQSRHEQAEPLAAAPPRRRRKSPLQRSEQVLT